MISITSTGHAILWSDAYTDENKSVVTNAKEFLISVDLGMPLTALRCFDNVIAIGDETGQIKYYDHNLMLLYWSPKLNFKRKILCIAPNRLPRVYKLDDSTMPQDFTEEKHILAIRDFIVTTSDGKMLAVNFLDSTFREIYYQADVVMSMDLHPNKNALCIASRKGRIVQYDVDQKNVLVETLLTLPKNTHINEVLFSERATHLVVSTNRGHIFELNTDILTLYNSKKPYKFTNQSITKMKFSDDSKLLALADAENNVILLYFCNKKWLLIGKNHSHRKDVCEMIFIQHSNESTPKLISIGKDMVHRVDNN